MEDILTRALACVRMGQRFAFATVITTTLKGTPRKAGAKMIVFEDGSTLGTIGGGRNEKAAIAQCLQSLRDLKPRTCTYNYFGREGESVCGGQMLVFIEPLPPKPRLIICGGGHIGLPLSWMAKVLGFHVTLIDNRRAFAAKTRFPHVDERICQDYAKALAKIKISSDHYIAVVTQGNEHDFACLQEVIAKPARYIGVISSQAKRVKFFGRLKKAGVPEGALKGVAIPMGLDLGAQTPAEIALSVCAQMVARKNQQLIGTDKFNQERISNG